jgi:patatin-like phospholipase/acyl hydrolase
LTIAWNYNKKEPRFFSKETYKNKRFEDCDWKISETMLASAANLLYFYPFVKKFQGEDNFYISGDNVAKSPALYAYEVATKLNGNLPSNIRMVSVGSIESLPFSISNE